MPDETTAPEAGAETTAPAETAPSVDLTPIEEQLSRFNGRFDAIEAALPQRQQEQEDDPYAGLEDYAHLLGYEPEPQAQGDPQAQLRALADLSREQARNELNPALQEMRGELQALRVERDLQALKTEHPKLNDPQVAEAVAQKVEEALVGLPPEARFNPHIVKLAYRAWEADQMATDEGSAQASHQQLENPAGAGPEGSEPDWNQRLIQNVQQSPGSAFWGLRS